MSGYVGDLSEEQTQALEKFREATKDVRTDGHDDHDLLRWLRARDFDLQKSEAMFREALKWRKEMGIDTLLATYVPPEVVKKYMSGGFLPGTDRQGYPVFISPYGRIDMTGILRSCKKQDVVTRFVHSNEVVTEACKKAAMKKGDNSGARHFLLIYDLQGFGLRHLERASIDVYLQAAKIAESRYPEILRKVIVINSPRVFPIVWRIVSPVLQEKTRKKISIFTDNYQEELLKEIAAEDLPVCYGGTLKDSTGDPACSEWICYGGTVPEQYYNQATAREGMTTVIVGRGSTVQLEYTIGEAKSVIRYEFCSEDCDIGFGVFKKTSDERQKAGEMEPVLTSSRVNSHIVPEDGFVECETPGTYVVRFDNTYSWARSKTIHYNIDVLEPKNEETLLKNNEINANMSKDPP